MNLLYILLIIGGIVALLLLFRWGYRDLVVRIGSIKIPEPLAPVVEEKKEEDVPTGSLIRKEPHLSPYQVIVENTSEEKQKVVIFGYSGFYKEPNYGSDSAVKISMTYGGTTYPQLLAESAFKPFSLNKLRIISNSKDQYNNEMFCVGKSASGSSYQFPLRVPREDYATDDRNQQQVLDVPLETQVNESVHFHFEINPKERMILNFFPDSQAYLSPIAELPSSVSYGIPNIEFGEGETFVDQDALDEMEAKREERRKEFDNKGIEKLKEMKPELFEKEGEEKEESVELSVESLDEIKENAPDNGEPIIAESVENYVTPEREAPTSPIQVEVHNAHDVAIVFKGEDLISGTFASLDVKPSRSLQTLADLGIEDCWVDLVRFQSDETIIHAVGKMGNSKEMKEGGRFIPDNELERGIFDLSYLKRYTDQELQLSDFEVEIKGGSKVTLTFFPLENVVTEEEDKTEEE
jgi:hypothetical protein